MGSSDYSFEFGPHYPVPRGWTVHTLTEQELT